MFQKIKNKILPFRVRISLLFSSVLPAYALEVPTDYYYIRRTSVVGPVTIYVPVNYAKYFGLGVNGIYNYPINEYSGSISMTAVDDNGVEYSVTFRSFSNATIRRSSGTSTTQETIFNIIETNVPALSSTDFTLFSNDTLVNMGMFLLIGGIFLLCIMRL